MAIKTMSASTGSGSKFAAGWHECTIRHAEYVTFEKDDGTTKRYIDVYFEDYPDNHNLRVYEAFNKTTNEEFKLANLFRYANAGIVGLLKDPNNKHPLIQYDDDTKNLIGAKINTYIYKETKTGNGYTRVFDDIVPVAQKGEHLSFTEEAVAALKKSREERCLKLHGKFSESETVSEGPSQETTSKPW